MGKTLGSILAVAAAVAVNVIPGVGQFLSAAIGSTLATAVISSVTLYGLQAGVSLLGLGPSGPKPETTETAIKTSRPPRVSAYGIGRLYGAYTLYETAPNGTAVDVYAVHDGKLDGVIAYYLGDEVVTLTGSTVNEGADGRYRGGAVNLYTTDGSVPGAGFPALVGLLPGIWTANHRGDGVVAMALTAKSVKAKYFQETYPQSTVPVPSMVARWQRCPDPAAVDPLNEAAWTWTENPVRQLLHYKLVREGPRPALPRSDAGYPAALAALRAAWWARKIAPTLQYWIDAAADCDAPRALKAGGTEPRYRSWTSHKHTDQHKGPVSALLATFDGWLAPRADGALVVYSGRVYEPDEADLIGPDEIVSYTWDGGRVDDDEAINEVICSYISAEHDYNSVECDAWRDEADITARGQVLSAPLEIGSPSWGQVRFLAKRLMARKNAPARGTVTTNIAGRKVQGKRFIPLHLEEAGTVFFSGIVEITSLTRAMRGGVTFQWVAIDPNIDNWNPATEEGEPAAKGDRVAPQPFAAPLITSGAAVFDADGVRVALEVDSPDRDDLTWFVHWRLDGASVWGPDEEYTDTDPGETVELRTGLVPPNATLEFQVAYQVGDGRFSDWSAIEEISTSTAPLAPGAATNLTAGGGETATIAWRNPTTSNFGYSRVYRGTTNVFGAAAQVGGDIVGGLGQVQQITDTPAAGTYYYWVRSFSTANVPSANPTGPAAAVLVTGPEMVTNGSFATDTDWTKETGWTISGGVANGAVAGNFFIYQAETGFVPGATYRLIYTLTRTSGGVQPILYGATSAGVGAVRTAAGTYQEDIVMGAGGSRANQIAFRAYDGSSFDFVGTIDNVSVKRIA